MALGFPELPVKLGEIPFDQVEGGHPARRHEPHPQLVQVLQQRVAFGFDLIHPLRLDARFRKVPLHLVSLRKTGLDGLDLD